MNPLGYVRTYPTKHLLNVCDPAPEDIDILDIAHHLSREGRYANGTAEFYSVAQHSWHVSFLLPEELAGWGLLHDASEAFLRDIPSPIKKLPAMEGYRAIEQVLQSAIYRRFGLEGAEPKEVHEADHLAYLYEEYLVRDATECPAVSLAMAKAWSPHVARLYFSARYEHLKQKGLLK